MHACLGRLQFAHCSPSRVTPGLGPGRWFRLPGCVSRRGTQFPTCLGLAHSHWRAPPGPGRLFDGRGAFLELRSCSCRSCAPCLCASPKIKVKVWRFSDVDRGQTVEVQMSKSVVSLTRSKVEGSVKSKSKCEGSEDQSPKNGGSLTRSLSGGGGSLTSLRIPG